MLTTVAYFLYLLHSSTLKVDSHKVVASAGRQPFLIRFPYTKRLLYLAATSYKSNILTERVSHVSSPVGL